METQQARYLTLQFTCNEKNTLFPDESSRLFFLRQAEKWLFQYHKTLVWSLGKTSAIIMIENPENMPALKSALSKINRKYSRYLRKKTGNKALMTGSKLTYLQDYTQTDLRDLVIRIHMMPMQQGLGENFIEYPWTSYLQLLNPKHCNLDHIEVISWFGSKQNYRKQHHQELVNITGK
jgi:hypothetical protein